MPIDEKKKPFLEQVGFDIERIEGNVKDKQEDAEAQGLESKEETEEEAQETKEEQPVLTAEAIMTVVETYMGPVIEELQDIRKEITELRKADAEKVAEKAAGTPEMSLEELAANRAQGLFGKDTQVDGRTALAKSGPKETPANQDPEGLFYQEWIGAAATQN